MKSYPVSTDRDHYRGSNASRQRKAAEYNRVAQRVEVFINDDLRAKPENAVETYLSRMVALQLGEEASVVQRIIFSLDCGHNGVTVLKGDPDLAMPSR